MTRRGLVVGCGGTLGFAWSVAALMAVEEALGWDSRNADVLVGTSAGSELVSILGSGRSARDLFGALDGASGADPMLVDHVNQHPGMVPPWPKLAFPGTGLTRAAVRSRHVLSGLAGLLPAGRGDAQWLRTLGANLSDDSGWVTHPATWLMAADVKSGQTVALGSPGAPKVDLGTAISASWAVPGWFPPVTIGGRNYLDGGAVSSASADIALNAEVDEVVIIAPMTSAGGAPARGLARAERVVRAQMTRRLDQEHRVLVDAGVKVIRIEPGPGDLAAMGANFMDLSRRESTLRTAVSNAPARVADALRHADTTGIATSQRPSSRRVS